MLHVKRDTVARSQHDYLGELLVQQQASVGQPCVVGTCASVHAGVVRLMIKDCCTLRWVAAEDNGPPTKGGSLASR